jgi:hypothetical protein
MNETIKIYFKISNYEEMVIATLGFVLNFCCIITLRRICGKLKSNSQMYGYLLIKSICDFMYFTTALFETIYFSLSDHLKHAYFFQLCFKYIFHYFDSAIMLSSVYFEVLGTIDCFLSIQNKYKLFLTKKAFYSSSFLCLFSIFIFYSAKFHVYRIVPFDVNSAITFNASRVHFYKTIKTDLYFNYFYKTIASISSFLRDILGTFLLILFNIFIFLDLKQMTAKKKDLRCSLAILKSIKAHEKKVKMIYFSAINSLLLHSPTILLDFYLKYQKTNFAAYYDSVSYNILMLSYVTPFIIYISFNKIFRKNFMILIRMRTQGQVVPLTPPQI